jgi:hypothetical protein
VRELYDGPHIFLWPRYSNAAQLLTSPPLEDTTIKKNQRQHNRITQLLSTLGYFQLQHYQNFKHAGNHDEQFLKSLLTKGLSARLIWLQLSKIGAHNDLVGIVQQGIPQECE